LVPLHFDVEMRMEQKRDVGTTRLPPRLERCGTVSFKAGGFGHVYDLKLPPDAFVSGCFTHAPRVSHV
jgi:hypothetical protein